MKGLISKWCHFWRDFRMSAFDKESRRQMRELTTRADVLVKEHQTKCPHLQGSNECSDVYGSQTSIIWHQLDRNGPVIGICTVCIRTFLPSDSDYEFWRKKHSGNRGSRGGICLPSNGFEYGSSDPAAFLNEERPEFVGTASDDLDSLSDEEIETLYQGVRKFARFYADPAKAAALELVAAEVEFRKTKPAAKRRKR